MMAIINDHESVTWYSYWRYLKNYSWAYYETLRISFKDTNEKPIGIVKVKSIK